MGRRGRTETTAEAAATGKLGIRCQRRGGGGDQGDCGDDASTASGDVGAVTAPLPAVGVATAADLFPAQGIARFPAPVVWHHHSPGDGGNATMPAPHPATLVRPRRPSPLSVLPWPSIPSPRRGLHIPLPPRYGATAPLVMEFTLSYHDASVATAAEVSLCCDGTSGCNKVSIWSQTA